MTSSTHQSMLPTDMLSLLKKRPSKNHAHFKSFPWALLLNTKLVDDIKASDTRRWRVKYTFEMPTALFDRVVAPLFNDPLDDEYTEIFCDVVGYSLILESIWPKIILQEDHRPGTISIKHLPSTEIEKTYMAYTEAKIHAHASHELFDLTSLLLQNLPEKIKLHVQRLTYKHKESKNITLYRDGVRFETGDYYTVFSIFADVPIDQVDNLTSTDEILDTSSNQEVMDVIRQHSAPARSKIIEFLYRHKRNIFDSLVEKGHVPEATESNDSNWDSDKEYDEPTDEHSYDFDERIDYCLERYGVGIQPCDPKFTVMFDNSHNKWEDE